MFQLSTDVCSFSAALSTKKLNSHSNFFVTSPKFKAASGTSPVLLNLDNCGFTISDTMLFSKCFVALVV